MRGLRLGIGLLLIASAGCKQRASTPAPTASTPAAGTPAASTPAGLVSLVATAELRGTTEPCGCNSDPLGDLARVAGLARGGLWLDAGNLLYEKEAAPATRRAQADLKAKAIAGIYTDAGAEAALGPSDLMGGVGKVAPPRQACNLPPLAELPLRAPAVRELDGLRVGVFGLSNLTRLRATAPQLAWPSAPTKDGAPATAAAEEAKRAIATLRAQRAEVIVAVMSLTSAEARQVMLAAPGIDFGVFGVDVEEGMPEAEPVGGGWLVAPADQGRRVARLDIARGTGPAGTPLSLKPFDGATGQKRALERSDKRIGSLKEQLAAWQADKSADPGFVAARKEELDALRKERDKLAAAPPVPPSPPYFTYTLVPVKRSLARDPVVADRLRALDREIGQANLAAAKDEPAPPAEPNRPSYAGDTACARCHKPAVAFWAKSHHAQAWKTLVDVDKQYNYDCIGCHVTGWQEPGGGGLGTIEKRGLVNVQCEVCHGPGSKHVEEQGLDEPKTMRRAPPDDFCRARCHTPEHSDTFELEAYLRDVLGAGHGEARRKLLGPGPTGHELRQKAMAAAAK